MRILEIIFGTLATIFGFIFHIGASFGTTVFVVLMVLDLCNVINLSIWIMCIPIFVTLGAFLLLWATSTISEACGAKVKSKDESQQQIKSDEK